MAEDPTNPAYEPFFNVQKTATEKDCHMRWLCGRDGKYFRCAFCGHKFVPGDLYRIVYTNDMKGAYGNPIVCEKCDGEDVRDRWRKMSEEAYSRFWWFSRPDSE